MSNLEKISALLNFGFKSKPINTLYHGSHLSDIQELQPQPHYLLNNQPAIFATPSREDAISFAVPWTDNDLSHGRINNGPLVLEERYPGAINKIYKNKSGYIYHIPDTGFKSDPRIQPTERYSDKPAKPIKVEKIENVLDELKRLGVQLKYKPYSTLYRFVSMNNGKVEGMYSAVDKASPKDDPRRQSKPDGPWLNKIGPKHPGMESYWTERGLKQYLNSGLYDWHRGVLGGDHAILIAKNVTDPIDEDENQVIVDPKKVTPADMFYIDKGRTTPLSANDIISRYGNGTRKYATIKPPKNPKPGSWIHITTDSTHPPKGTFSRDAAEIAEIMAKEEVSPKGLGSAIKMIQFFINRGGKRLKPERLIELNKAKRILQKKLHQQREKKADTEDEELEKKKRISKIRQFIRFYGRVPEGERFRDRPIKNTMRTLFRPAIPIVEPKYPNAGNTIRNVATGIGLAGLGYTGYNTLANQGYHAQNMAYNLGVRDPELLDKVWWQGFRAGPQILYHTYLNPDTSPPGEFLRDYFHRTAIPLMQRGINDHYRNINPVITTTQDVARSLSPVGLATTVALRNVPDAPEDFNPRTEFNNTLRQHVDRFLADPEATASSPLFGIYRDMLFTPEMLGAAARGRISDAAIQPAMWYTANQTGDTNLAFRIGHHLQHHLLGIHSNRPDSVLLNRSPIQQYLPSIFGPPKSVRFNSPNIPYSREASDVTNLTPTLGTIKDNTAITATGPSSEVKTIESPSTINTGE